MSEQHQGNQNFWNFLFSIFFVVVLGAATWLVYDMRGAFPTTVPVFDVFLMAFATLRITRLIVYDKIARWFRDLFTDAQSGIRHTIGDLLECPWCIGVWSGLLVATCYFIFPWAWFVIFFLALAGMGSLLQVLANLVGWQAENLKFEAKEKDRNLHL